MTAVPAVVARMEANAKAAPRRVVLKTWEPCGRFCVDIVVPKLLTMGVSACFKGWWLIPFCFLKNYY